MEPVQRSPADSRKSARVDIVSELDILAARQKGRVMAQELGLSSTDQTVIATVVSELARNILLYAKPGTLTLGIVQSNGRSGIEVVARDKGPGIPDVEAAMRVGFSTSRSLGLGLPGVRRLMDDFEIVSKIGKGTTVTAKKWKR